MKDNVFLKEQKKYELADYMDFDINGRENLGSSIPVSVYRLLEYSVREEVTERFGREIQAEIFRGAGRRAGNYFAQKMLDITLPYNAFIAQLQTRMAELKIGVLRIEKFNQETGRIVLTVSEDVDCSGLPLLGEYICNFDEGFIAEILSVYTGKHYTAEEVDCWATGDRVCRFCAEIKE